MAEARRGDIVVRLFIETQNADKVVEDLTEKVNELGVAIKSVKAEEVGKSFGKLGDEIRARTTPFLIQFTYLLQDIPFGLRGVANNLQLLVHQFVVMRMEGIRLSAMLKDIFDLMRGPMGLLFGFSILTSALQIWEFYVAESAKKVNKLKDDLDELLKVIKKFREDLEGFNLTFGDLDKKLDDVAEKLGFTREQMMKLGSVAGDLNLTLLGGVYGLKDIEQGLVALAKSAKETGKGLKTFIDIAKENKAAASDLNVKLKEMDKNLRDLYIAGIIAEEVNKYKENIEGVIKSAKELSTVDLVKLFQNTPVKVLSGAVRELNERIRETADASERLNLVRAKERLEEVIKKLTDLNVKQKGVVKSYQEEVEILKTKANLTDDELERIELLRQAKIKELEISYKSGQISEELYLLKLKEIDLWARDERVKVRHKELLSEINLNEQKLINAYETEIELLRARAEIEEDEMKRIDLLVQAKKKELELRSIREYISAEERKAKEIEIERWGEEQKKKIREKALREQIDREYEVAKFRAQSLDNEYARLVYLKNAELDYIKRQYEAGLITQEEFSSKRLYIEKSYQDEVARMRLDYFKDISLALRDLSKEDTSLAKSLAIANALINTYEGATKALAKYPPPWNLLLASVVVGAGLSYVSKIASVGFQRGGFTGEGRKDEVAGVVHKGEFVFESDIVQRERANLESLRLMLKSGKSLTDIIMPRVVSQTTTVEKVIIPRIENKIEIKADFDYLKFFVKEFKKFNKYQERKTR